MKIRVGFVSNSSSSSFVAVGIQAREDIMEELGWPDRGSPEDYGFEELDHGCYAKDGIVIYCIDWEPFFIGLDAFPEFAADLRLSEIKEKAVKAFEKLGIEVDIRQIHLECGECGGG